MKWIMVICESKSVRMRTRIIAHRSKSTKYVNFVLQNLYKMCKLRFTIFCKFVSFCKLQKKDVYIYEIFLIYLCEIFDIKFF